VQVVTVDEVLAERGIAPDEVRLLWLDVQGFEGHVVAGATQLVERSTPLVFASRPRKLARAGGLERLAELVAEHYDEIVDLRDPSATPAPAADLTDILAYARPA
jgi:methyltransferase FkbM-like protein